MLQINQSIEETARDQGIGWIKRMVEIVIPLSFSGLVLGMLLTFITAVRELSHHSPHFSHQHGSDRFVV